MNEDNMATIVDFIDRVIKISIRVQEKTGKAIKDFNKAIEEDEEIKKIREEVIVSFKL